MAPYLLNLLCRFFNPFLKSRNFKKRHVYSSFEHSVCIVFYEGECTHIIETVFLFVEDKKKGSATYLLGHFATFLLVFCMENRPEKTTYQLDFSKLSNNVAKKTTRCYVAFSIEELLDFEKNLVDMSRLKKKTYSINYVAFRIKEICREKNDLNSVAK
jgi:hypothetical protein